MSKIAALLLGAFVYLHAPGGGIVAIYPNGGQIIIRRAPPGFGGNTQILTGSGNVVVTETPCEVAHAFDIACSATMEKH